MRYRWLLAGLGAVLLALGLAGPVTRWLERHPADNATGTTADHQRELARRYSQDRGRILAEMQAALANGDNAAAMSIGAPYYILGDPELVTLHREATARESRRQNVDELRNIVGRQCTEVSARLLAVQFLRRYARAPDQELSDVSLVRLRDDEAHARVLDRIASSMRAPEPHATDPVSRAWREHRVRVHPDYVAAVSQVPFDEGLVCVWRLRGEVAERPVRTIELEFWLAPSLARKNLDLEPLAYSGR